MNKVFCVGGDMDWFKDCIEDMLKFCVIVLEVKWIVMLFLDLEKLIICWLNGVVVGLGVMIVFMCDVIVVLDRVVIGDLYVKVGFVVGDGGVIIWL